MRTRDSRPGQSSRFLAHTQEKMSHGRDDRAPTAVCLAGGATKPRWAWLFWVQLAIVLLAMLGAYLGLLDLSALAVPGMDKTLHFVLYGALAFFSVRWWADRRPRTILGIMSVLAILEEASQSLSAARTFSVIDLTAALLGIFVLGFAAHRLVHGRRRALKRRRSA